MLVPPPHLADSRLGKLCGRSLLSPLPGFRVVLSPLLVGSSCLLGVSSFPMIVAALASPPLGCRIADIVSLRANEQVQRIAAGRGVAVV
jgi:hypothetical protein